MLEWKPRGRCWQLSDIFQQFQRQPAHQPSHKTPSAALRVFETHACAAAAAEVPKAHTGLCTGPRTQQHPETTHPHTFPRLRCLGSRPGSSSVALAGRRCCTDRAAAATTAPAAATTAAAAATAPSPAPLAVPGAAAGPQPVWARRSAHLLLPATGRQQHLLCQTGAAGAAGAVVGLGPAVAAAPAATTSTAATARRNGEQQQCRRGTQQQRRRKQLLLCIMAEGRSEEPRRRSDSSRCGSAGSGKARGRAGARQPAAAAGAAAGPGSWRSHRAGALGCVAGPGCLRLAAPPWLSSVLQEPREEDNGWRQLEQLCGWGFCGSAVVSWCMQSRCGAFSFHHAVLLVMHIWRPQGSSCYGKPFFSVILFFPSFTTVKARPQRYVAPPTSLISRCCAAFTIVSACCCCCCRALHKPMPVVMPNQPFSVHPSLSSALFVCLLPEL